MVETTRQHEQWKEHVRDPALRVNEGRRFLVVPGAHASYAIAELPSGKWAISQSFAYTCGNFWGQGHPWTEMPDREACVSHFTESCRRHFAESFGCDSQTSSAQSNARQKMIDLLDSLKDGLFGFREPEAQPEGAWVYGDKIRKNAWPVDAVPGAVAREGGEG